MARKNTNRSSSVTHSLHGHYAVVTFIQGRSRQLAVWNDQTQELAHSPRNMREAVTIAQWLAGTHSLSGKPLS